MTTLEASLRKLANHPSRRLIVIIVTLGTGLVTVLPAVDEYFALREQCAQLEQSIAQAQSEIADLGNLEVGAEDLAGRLADLESRAVQEDDAHVFREDLVEMTRQAGCHLRRLQLAPPTFRPWIDGDHPVQPPPKTDKPKETPYQLRTQRLSLSVSGPLESVQQLLASLRATGKLLHAERFNMRPLSSEQKEVLLDLELTVFGLESQKKVGVST